jgi:hypothetical protein
MSNPIEEVENPEPQNAAPEAARNDDKEGMAELLAIFADVSNLNQRAFLAAFLVTKGVRRAERLSGLTHWSHYHWMKTDPLYRRRFELVKRILTDEAEEEAYRRAFLGCDTPIVYRGKVTDSYKRYSDALAILLLKGFKPEVYRAHRPDCESGTRAPFSVTVKKEGEENDGALSPPESSIPPGESEK